MQGIDLTEHLLAVGVVHLRELRGKNGIHLILCEFVGDLHIGEWQESCREVFRRGKRALTRVGIEQHLVALRTVVLW